MKKIYEIYVIETGYPTIGITDNMARVIYKSYKKFKEKRDFFYEISINNKWELIPYYNNVVDFYKDWIIERGKFPGLKGNRCWAFSEIEKY